MAVREAGENDRREHRARLLFMDEAFDRIPERRVER
jgi:hypothetical protein